MAPLLYKLAPVQRLVVAKHLIVSHFSKLINRKPCSLQGLRICFLLQIVRCFDRYWFSIEDHGIAGLAQRQWTFLSIFAYLLHISEHTFQLNLKMCLFTYFSYDCLLESLTNIHSTSRYPPSTTLELFNGEVLVKVRTFSEGISHYSQDKACHVGRRPSNLSQFFRQLLFHYL